MDALTKTELATMLFHISIASASELNEILDTVLSRHDELHADVQSKPAPEVLTQQEMQNESQQ